MKLTLNPELNRRLREKINEWNNFTCEKKANFKSPEKRGKFIETQAYNCICACLDRIDELVEHCNALELKSLFGLYDIFNYGQTLIDCISMISKIYNVPYEAENDISCFNQKGNDGSGNDEKYFKYLRSLCSVHPVETSQHKIYQGNEPEWCPYISGSGVVMRMLENINPELKNADYYAVVYRNDMEFNKYVPIRVSQIIQYLSKRYEHIEKIVQAIDRYNDAQIADLIEKHIPLPEESDTYISYLLGLKEAFAERCGDKECYQIKEWIGIMKAHFADEKMQSELQEFQETMKEGIKEIHNKLQNMEIDDCFNENPVRCRTNFIPNGYALEKLHYLEDIFMGMPDEEAYKLIEKGGEPFINDRLNSMLSIISKAQASDLSEEEMMDVAREIDYRFKVTNSEWARVLLKIIEPYFANTVEFDYLLDDWYLYLQIKIAFWRMSKKR